MILKSLMTKIGSIIPNQLNEGDRAVLKRFVQGAYRVDRTHWERTEHYPEDLATWQVGVVVSVNALGQPSHYTVDSSEMGASAENSKYAMRIREVYQIAGEYDTVAGKVIGEVFSSREALEGHLQKLKKG